jgi:hypothetical protein
MYSSYSYYYSKQPIETHGMCKMTGQGASAEKSNKGKYRNINKNKTRATISNGTQTSRL